AIPDLKILVSTLIKSIPPLIYVTLLVSLLFYVYAVMGTFLFRENDPIHFHSLHLSLLSLFRVVTLEDWTDLMYIAMYGCNNYGYSGNEALCTKPEAFPVIGWIYYVSFIMIGTFVLFNLLIGIIISKMEDSKMEARDDAELEDITVGKNARVLEVIHSLKEDLQNLEKHVHSLELAESDRVKEKINE
ncbi:MAG: ion transporter, partial [Nitrospinae bacterium]|nr:ion transporter [Nitrospinota bacterium]